MGSLRYLRPLLSETLTRARLVVLLLVSLLFRVAGAGAVEFAGSWKSQLIPGFEERAWEMEGKLMVTCACMGWEVEGVIEFDLQEWWKVEVEASLELRGIEFGSELTLDPIKACLRELAIGVSSESQGWHSMPISTCPPITAGRICACSANPMCTRSTSSGEPCSIDQRWVVPPSQAARTPCPGSLHRPMPRGYTSHVVGSFAVGFLEFRLLWSSENALLR